MTSLYSSYFKCSGFFSCVCLCLVPTQDIRGHETIVSHHQTQILSISVHNYLAISLAGTCIAVFYHLFQSVHNWLFFSPQHDSHTCTILIDGYISFPVWCSLDCSHGKMSFPIFYRRLGTLVTHIPVFCRQGRFNTMLKVGISPRVVKSVFRQSCFVWLHFQISSVLPSVTPHSSFCYHPAASMFHLSGPLWLLNQYFFPKALFSEINTSKSDGRKTQGKIYFLKCQLPGLIWMA